jgi:TonB family protein
MLAIIVDQSGGARDIRVVRSLGHGLDEKAIEAVNKWKFRPGMKGGQPVNVRAQIEVNFRLLRRQSGYDWYSGQMAFITDKGMTPPEVTDGAMPKPAKEPSDESVELEFTVTSSGSAIKTFR